MIKNNFSRIHIFGHLSIISGGTKWEWQKKSSESNVYHDGLVIIIALYDTMSVYLFNKRVNVYTSNNHGLTLYISYRTTPFHIRDSLAPFFFFYYFHFVEKVLDYIPI